ncbi:MAG: ABC transporter permease, partial [Clostridia bacterium]|nr:ABC transporter permease [Clostridia bacterium]
VSVALANTISSICQEINMLQYEMIAKQNTTQITKLSAILYDVSPNSQLFLMIPMFITMFLFSGISSVSVDIFAGEKERNTLEVLLVAQIDRRIVLVSKMMAIMIVGFISAIVSVVGYILSIIISSKMFEELHITIGYSIKEYAFFFLNTVLLTLLATMIYSLISITSRSVKEAQSLSSFITLIPGLLSAVLVSSPSNIIDYPSMMLPIYNNIVFFKSILVGTESLLAIIVILLVDLIVAFFLFVICDSMLNNEKYILKYE